MTSRAIVCLVPLLLVMAGCQPKPSPSMSAPAVTVASFAAQCEMVADFPQAPQEVTAKEGGFSDLPGLTYGRGWSAVTPGGASLVASCWCIEGDSPKAITEYQARRSLAFGLEKRGWEITSFRFADGPFSIAARAAFDVPTSPAGALKGRWDHVYGEKCQMLFLAFYKGTPQNSRVADDFMRSIRPMAAAASSPSTTIGQGAAQRLQQLDDLLEQKLISPAEYQRRREAIVNSL